MEQLSLDSVIAMAKQMNISVSPNWPPSITAVSRTVDMMLGTEFAMSTRRSLNWNIPPFPSCSQF